MKQGGELRAINARIAQLRKEIAELEQEKERLLRQSGEETKP